MCDPFTAAVVSGALSIAGSAMSGIAQKNQVQAQNEMQQQAMERNKKLRQDELARQDAMREKNQRTLDEEAQRNDPSLRDEEVKNTGEDRAQEAQKFADDVASMSPDAVATTANDNSSIIKDDLQKRLAQAAGKSREKIAAFAKLGGYEEAFKNRARAAEGANRDINLVNNLRGGSLASAGIAANLNDKNIGTPNPTDMTLPAIVSGIGTSVNGAIKGGYFG